MKDFTGKYVALLMVATLGVVAVGFTAHAGTADMDAGSRVVRYADLNLNTAAGAKVLYKRIRDAAVQVCGDTDSRQLDQAAAAKACVDRAVVASVHAVNRVQLTHVANANGHRVEATFNIAAAR